MMTVRAEIDDRGYFTRRAREERQRAATAEDNSAALAHLRMAEMYDRKAESLATRIQVES